MFKGGVTLAYHRRAYGGVTLAYGTVAAHLWTLRPISLNISIVVGVGETTKYGFKRDRATRSSDSLNNSIGEVDFVRASCASVFP
jgi:hypothetical protein